MRKWMSIRKTKDSDEKLLNAFQQTGQQRYAERLIERHLHIVYGQALSFLKIPADAEDATVQIMAGLPEKLLKYPVKNFRAWLSTVTRNHCLKILKEKIKQRTEAIDEKNESLFVEFPAFETLEKEDLAYEQLTNAIHQLKDEQRRCILAFYFQNLSYRKVAELECFTEKEVKSHIQNGKKNLRKLLTQ